MCIRDSRTAAAPHAGSTVRVVPVRQLFPCANVSRGPGPDDTVDHLRVAVRPAGVIDESGEVTADRRIDHGTAVDGEAPDASGLEMTLLAAPALAVGDPLAVVVDDPRVLGDRRTGEHTPARDVRRAADQTDLR